MIFKFCYPPPFILPYSGYVPPTPGKYHNNTTTYQNAHDYMPLTLG